MTLPIRPEQGGFLRPFGCAWFIREFLLGHGPNGSPMIDPDVGATQTDIHRYYKDALFRAYAEDAVAREEEQRIAQGLPPFTIKDADERARYYFQLIPQRLTRMRYPSFTRYFAHLKRLSYVEKSGKEEPSLVQESYPLAPPRRYYRLTDAGKNAAMEDLADPINTIYRYPRAKRSPKKHLDSHRRKA